MSIHSYSRCWLHLVWATLNRERMLFGEPAAKVPAFLSQYAGRKGIYMRINCVNPEHVHALIELPAQYSVEDVFKLLKGASSHWINQNRLVRGKFFWGRGYGDFSVSQSQLDEVAQYIATREEHHQRKTFLQKYESLVKLNGLPWHGEETVKTVGETKGSSVAPR